MKAEEAKVLLGFAPNSRPTPSQVKAAYLKRVWETHPDRFPSDLKSGAEVKFKLISEAQHVCLLSSSGGGGGFRRGNPSGSCHYHSPEVVYRAYGGVPRAGRGTRNHALAIGVPFLFIIAGTVALGVSIAARSYRRQKDAYPSHNPFLP